MKIRHCVIALTLVVLAVPASAQELGFGGFGPRVGVSSDPDQGFVGIHFNFGEFAPHLRFQPNAEVAAGDDHTTLSVTAPVHYRFVVNGGVTPYVGGGVTVALDDVDRPRGRDDTDLEIGARGIGGVEWPLRDGNDFFLELTVGFGDIQDVQVLAGWMFGTGQRRSPSGPSRP